VVDYIVDIGLEVHVELATRTKMFCGCPVIDPTHAEPNTAVCPVCTGMPGVLPVVNKKAVEFGIKAALALKCKIAEQSIFARKNYFYPDLPKGYQISQYEYPLAKNGYLKIVTSQGERTIRIRRAHLEEDTGKLTHFSEEGNSFSLVDLNRSGIPLLEIVTEPDMHSIEEALAYSHALHTLLRYLEVTTGDMEKGAMRFEANVSLRPANSNTLGKRVEIKNLNSFRAMDRAISYQITQQRKLLEKGRTVTQETLGWDDVRSVTVAQRSKEESHDYRYFPEPDLPPLIVEKDWLKKIATSIPELPYAKKQRYKKEYGLQNDDIDRLINEKPVAEYFETCLQEAAHISPKVVANWITGELFSWMNQSGEHIQDLRVHPKDLVELLRNIERKTINQNTAKDVLLEMLHSGKSSADIIQQKDLQQISDGTFIECLIRNVLTENPQEVDYYLNGKETVANWFFGQVMSAAKGKANPEVVKEELARQLELLKSG
jgi:aspartyl-tRNA(Asn)/glutamyl-tRNA(Gln) amidotransferase subunit B